jgi:predicted lactoylglutathione lyase
MELLKTGQSISLKEYGCRMGARLIKESPLAFDQPIKQSDIADILSYNRNDVEQTLDLFNEKCKALIDARKGLDELFGIGHVIYTMSEAKIAQNVFLQLYKNKTGLSTSELRARADLNPNNRTNTFPVAALAAKRVHYKTHEFKSFYDDFLARATITNNKLQYEYATLKLANRVLKLGAGGLHSCDGNTIWEETDTHCIVDLDVASYYPNLIISLQIYPEHLGSSILEEYISTVEMRIRAKAQAKKCYKEGDKEGFAKWNGIANSLKIVVNAFFGKLGDKFSPLCDVAKAHTVTLNGQLYILMLIERMYMAGYKIISANTDGITIYMPRDQTANMKAICKEWEEDTKMELEEARYKKFIQRDINNYLAIKLDGEIKSKGMFALDEAKKNSGKIITMAIRAQLTGGTIEDVINSPDIKVTDFAFYQRVKNGGVITFGRTDIVIGKIARWVVGCTGVSLYRFKNDKYTKIPDTTNAEILMENTGAWLMHKPWYIETAHTRLAKALTNATNNEPNDPALADAQRYEPCGVDDDA